MLFNCFRSTTATDDTLSVCSSTTSLEKPVHAHLEQEQEQVGPPTARYSPLSTQDARQRLDGLRREMEDSKVDVYIVPTADAHGSEYVGHCDKRRSWLSGFTGSAGVAIVVRSPPSAHLFTDSRYYTQATHELDPALWTLHKVGLPGVQNWPAWLAAPESENGIGEGARVGVDAEVVDYATVNSLRPQLEKRSLALVFPAQGNLVDRVWGDARPARAAKPIREHGLEFSGKAASAKLADLRSYLSSHYPSSSPDKPPSFLISTLPALAWLLNLRGSDIAFNPVFYGYLLVRSQPDEVVLYVQKSAVGEEVGRYVREELGGRVEEYEGAVEGLRKLAGEGERVVADGRVSWAIAKALGTALLPLPAGAPNPVDAAQAVKNPVEIEGFRRAYTRDGLAWVRWLAWLEEMLLVKKQQVTEWDAAEELTKYRKDGEHFAGLAYENISATGENAALPHYAPSPDHPVPISLTTPYLNDSGAQYLDGTIDTTRTYHFSPLLQSSSSPFSRLRRGGKKLPAELETHRRAFTRVLQGHIALDRLVFPEGTTGVQVDALARWRLWSEGWDYGHGTGHGVGEYLSVHETQVGISHSANYFNTPFLPGHITSNEPAFYDPSGSTPGAGGHGFGIRIESVVGVKEMDPTGTGSGGMRTRREGEKRWFGFERFTTVPIQSSLVDPALLTPEEAAWLKAHNQTCKDKLLPLIKAKGDERARRWLERQ
ncbi:hypothetical protein JCM8097_001201 [Rhodosporidiobolus ruineniae]